MTTIGNNKQNVAIEHAFSTSASAEVAVKRSDFSQSRKPRTLQRWQWREVIFRSREKHKRCRGGSEEKWFFAVEKSMTVVEVAVLFCRGGSQEKQDHWIQPILFISFSHSLPFPNLLSSSSSHGYLRGAESGLVLELHVMSGMSFVWVWFGLVWSVCVAGCTVLGGGEGRHDIKSIKFNF